ncbi:MAG: O-antigen ligase family protein [Bacteroidales bacterium]|nr:O-antigen ligase family protein [Bacteroidales bacterium]
MGSRVKIVTAKKISAEPVLFYGFAGIAFFLPLFSPVSDLLTYVVFAVFIVTHLSEPGTSRIRLRDARFSILTGIALFLLTFFHLFTGTNKGAIVEQLDQYMAILIFPLSLAFFSSGESYPRRMQSILNFTLAGTIVTTLVLYAAAFLRFIETHTAVEFYYIKLGNGLHPSYMSMLVVLALAIVLDGWLAKKWINRNRKLVRPLLWIAAGWLIIFNTLLASKAGIIVQTLVLLLFALKEIQKKDFRRLIGLSAMLITSLVMIPFAFPFTFSRFVALEETLGNSLIRNEWVEKETTNSRLLGWDAAMDIIIEHPITGVGPEKVQHALKNSYEENGLGYGNRNPHNQYLQTWLELGLPGLIILLMLAVIPGWYALREKNYLHIAFLLIVFIHMLFESTLERRLGVMIFAFWSSLFWFYTHNQRKSKKTVITG